MITTNGSKSTYPLTALCDFVVSGLTKILTLLFLMHIFVAHGNKQGKRVTVDFPWLLWWMRSCVSVVFVDGLDNLEQCCLSRIAVRLLKGQVNG